MAKVSVLRESEKIFESMMAGEIKPIAPAPRPPIGDQAPAFDISNVSLDGMETFLESVGAKVEKKVKPVEQPKKAVPDDLIPKLESLMISLGTILKEVKGVVTEMTTVGMLGTGTAKGFKKKKANGPTKACKRN